MEIDPELLGLMVIHQSLTCDSEIQRFNLESDFDSDRSLRFIFEIHTDSSERFRFEALKLHCLSFSLSLDSSFVLCDIALKLWEIAKREEGLVLIAEEVISGEAVLDFSDRSQTDFDFEIHLRAISILKFSLSISKLHREEFILNSRGVKLFTCRWLPTNSEPKALIFLCHGYAMECSISMKGTGTRLAQAGLAVYGMDYEGHGKSSGLHGFVPCFDHLVTDCSDYYSSICEPAFIPQILIMDQPNEAMLHFIYRDALVEEEWVASSSSLTSSISDTLTAKLLAAADKYDLGRLRRLCESHLCKYISVNSVAKVLALADRFHATELKAVCLRFAAENLAAVMRSDGFEYLKENCPSLQSELLKTLAGCEDDCSSGGGKSRSVWAQLSDGGDTNSRRVRQRT